MYYYHIWLSFFSPSMYFDRKEQHGKKKGNFWNIHSLNYILFCIKHKSKTASWVLLLIFGKFLFCLKKISVKSAFLPADIAVERRSSSLCWYIHIYICHHCLPLPLLLCPLFLFLCFYSPLGFSSSSFSSLPEARLVRFDVWGMYYNAIVSVNLLSWLCTRRWFHSNMGQLQSGFFPLTLVGEVCMHTVKKVEF
jgi:hypothetical protein